MAFKSTIDRSDACPAALSEAELDRVTGGRIKEERPERLSVPNSGGGGDLIDNRWSQHPVYLGPF